MNKSILNNLWNKLKLKLKLIQNIFLLLEYCAPLTCFDWNDTDPSIVGTCSIDTTCTIWDVNVILNILLCHVMIWYHMICDVMIGFVMVCYDMTCNVFAEWIKVIVLYHYIILHCVNILYVMSCHVMSCHVMSCHVMPCHVMLCHVMSCHVMLCHALICYEFICYLI